MIGERDAGETRGSGRSAAFADRNVVVYFEGEGFRRFFVRAHDLAVGGQDEMILDLSANGGVAAGGDNGVGPGNTRFESKMNVESERGCIEGRSEIGRGGRKRDAKNGSGFIWHSRFGIVLSAGSRTCLSSRRARLPCVWRGRPCSRSSCLQRLLRKIFLAPFAASLRVLCG